MDYIAIFEDDVYLGENADYFLNDDGWIPEECEVIKLEKFSNYCSTKKTPIIIQERQINIIKEMHLGASGYILSQNICQYLLGYIKNSNPIIAVDHILFENILNDENDAVFFPRHDRSHGKIFFCRIDYLLVRWPIHPDILQSAP